MNINSTLTLNNSVEIPILGLGMYLISSGEIVRNTLNCALKSGYRHFDTAAFYANEKEIGQAIRESDIPREEIFVTTKLWNDDHGYDSTLYALDLSLSKLGLDYIDLYLIHWPVEGLRLESWRAMEKAFTDGKTRAIGVSNYMKHHLEELLNHCNSIPAINQIELSPFNYLSRKDSIDFCLKNKIMIEAYSPLTKGYKLSDPNLTEIAGRYGKSTAQILIRWALEHRFVVIPKSSNLNRIVENMDVFDFSISAQDMEFLDGLNENLATSWDPTNAP
jgi:diketogulonate reductase-like aldo/keto reductase